MSNRYSVEPLEQRRLMASGTILFIRGADRSGGFLEATNDAQRTEELSDINNTSTAAGNHGWGTLASVLRGQGYTVKQVSEPLESGAPGTGQTMGRALALQDMNLSQYAAVVMGSNNAVYGHGGRVALDNYVREGGGVLFISDGNFGSSWADAPSSDNAFLASYGMVFNQDNGQYTLSRSAGDFIAPSNPILIDVNAFDGEGVSPIRQTKPVNTELVGARGTTFDNNPTSTANHSRGTERPVDGLDASLDTAFVGAGRVAAFFDRNTFFNANGAGTDITKNDNRQLAINLFNWVADHAAPAVTQSAFVQSTRRLTFRLDDNLAGSLTRDDIRLRNRRTGETIAGRNFSLALTEGNGFTDVAITLKSGVPAGAYQLQINRGTISDDSGNVRTGAIRYAFTIVPASQLAGTVVANSLKAIDLDDDTIAA